MKPETSLLKYVEVLYKGESLIALQYKNKVIIEYDPAVWQDTLWVDGATAKTINALIKNKKATGVVIDAAKAYFTTQDQYEGNVMVL